MHKRFSILTQIALTAALQIFSVAVSAGPGSAAPTEPAPVFLTEWGTPQDREPWDLFTFADKVYMVAQTPFGDFFSVGGAYLGGFAAGDPISNDRQYVTDVAVSPDGRIFAVGDFFPPAQLWRFAADGTRIGWGTPLGVHGLNAVVIPDDSTLLIAANDYQGTVTIVDCDLNGTRRSALWTVHVGWSSRVDMAVSPSGAVYIADESNRILKYSRSGVPLGSWGSPGTGEGQFDYPSGVAVDDAGNVYVSEYNNNRVQKFGPDGTFKVMWGGFLGSPAGPGAALYRPNAVACLPNNKVVVGSVVPTYYGLNGRTIKVFQSSTPATPSTRATWGQLKSRYRPGASAIPQDE